MMGYVYVTSACFGCGQIFSYHPNHVPSIRDPRTGKREPICRACVERANPLRIKNGLEPIRLKRDAYEACPEEDVQWE
jgi:hypothetical protein